MVSIYCKRLLLRFHSESSRIALAHGDQDMKRAFGGSFWRMASSDSTKSPSPVYGNTAQAEIAKTIPHSDSSLKKSVLQFKPIGVPITNLSFQTNQLLQNMIRLQTFGKSIMAS